MRFVAPKNFNTLFTLSGAVLWGIKAYHHQFELCSYLCLDLASNVFLWGLCKNVSLTF
jgi:hypothetical protein